MSGSNSRRNVFAAVALGILGVGCGPAESGPAESQVQSPSPRSQRLASSGWSVKGLMRGTIRSDELLDVMVVAPNKVLVAGYENGDLGLSHVDPSGASAYGLIARYSDPYPDDASQELVLERQWLLGRTNNTTDVIEGISLEAGSPDRVFFTGRTTGSYDKANMGQFDTLAGWLNTTTNVYSAFQSGDARPQHPRHVAVDANHLVIGGYTDTHVVGNYVQAWEDPLIQKLRRNGETLEDAAGTHWTAPVFNTPITDLQPGLCVEKTAGSISAIYVSGANSAGTNRGMFVRKYWANGSLAWEKKPTNVSLDMAAAVAMNPLDGNVLFAGATYATFGTPYGDQDVVVANLFKDTGNMDWAYQYGSSGPDWVTDMTVDSAGNIYVVGETLGSFDPAVPFQGEIDVFVLKLSADRKTQQVFQTGTPGDDHPSAIAVDEASGKIYVAGYTSGNLVEGFQNYGVRDGFLLQLTPPAEVSF